MIFYVWDYLREVSWRNDLTYLFERLQYLTITDEMLEQLAPLNEAVKNEISFRSAQITDT